MRTFILYAHDGKLQCSEKRKGDHQECEATGAAVAAVSNEALIIINKITSIFFHDVGKYKKL